MNKLLVAIFVVMAVACGSHTTPIRTASEVPEAQRRLATYIFGEGAKQYSLNNHDEAYSLMQQTLRINPRHTGALAILAQYETYMRNNSLADSLLTRALDIDPKNKELLEMNAALCGRIGNDERTLDAYEKLSAAMPRNQQILTKLVQLYARAGMTDSAIVTLDRIESIAGISEQISNTKHLLYLQAGDTTAAMEELQNLVHEYPADPNYAVLLGNAYSRVLNEPDSAMAIFDDVERRDPTNGRLQLARLNLYQMYDSIRYNAYFDSLLYSPCTDGDLLVTLTMRYASMHHNKPNGRAMTTAMFDSVLATPREGSRLLATYAAYLSTVKAGNDTLRPVLERLITEDPSNRTALIQLLQIHISDNNSTEVGRICDQAITYYTHEPVFYYYSAMGHYLAGDTLVALDRLTVGCEHIDDDTDVGQAADMWTMQGDILYKTGRKQEAYAAYDSCLAYQPDNIACLNNYAYFLSLDNTRLDEAEHMSYRAVKAQPKNKTYIDTYAWILYMEHRYDEAAQQMDIVMEDINPSEVTEEPEDISADVFDHAGDIYAANGNHARAVLFWQAAERLGCGNKELRRKIRRK